MAQADDRPSDTLVRFQVTRLSDLAGLTATESRVFSEIVERTLAQKRSRQYELASAINPEEPNDTSDNIRVHTFNVRVKLKKYYQTDGRDDLVIITLPKGMGQGYAADFSYNQRAEAVREHQKAWVALSQNRLRDAYEHVRAAIDRAPEYPEAVATKAYVNAMYKFMPSSTVSLTEHWSSRYLTVSLESDVEALERALKDGDGSWWCHIVSGAINMCVHRWAQADIDFEKAMRISREQTECEFCYMAYRMAKGDTEWPLQTMKAIVQQSPTNVVKLVQYGWMCYACGDFAEAYRSFDAAADCVPDLSMWALRLGLVLTLLDRTDEELLTFDGEVRRHDAGMAVSRILNAKPAVPMVGVSHFFRAKVLLRDVELSVEERSLEMGIGSTWESAIIQMAYNDNRWAISALEEACFETYDPSMVWLHLWPIFKPLRQYPEFIGLLKEVGLPESAPSV